MAGFKRTYSFLSNISISAQSPLVNIHHKVPNKTAMMRDQQQDVYECYGFFIYNSIEVAIRKKSMEGFCPCQKRTIRRERGSRVTPAKSSRGRELGPIHSEKKCG